MKTTNSKRCSLEFFCNKWRKLRWISSIKNIIIPILTGFGFSVTLSVQAVFIEFQNFVDIVSESYHINEFYNFLSLLMYLYRYFKYKILKRSNVYVLFISWVLYRFT